MSVASFAGVNHYRDLRFFGQLFRLDSITNRVVNLDITNPNHQAQILDWQAVAHRLNTSINANRPFFRMIGDFLTLQFIKKWVVQASLPGLIQRVDAAAARVLTHRALPPVAPAPPFAPPRPLQGRVTISTNDSSKSLDIFLRAQQYFQANKEALCKAEASKSHRWNGVGQDTTAKEAEKEIDEYFQRKINLLVDGHRAAVPLWYHATKDHSFIPIINSGNLEQHNAFMGRGVYFSTEDEHDFYGKYTFAVDYDIINSLPAERFATLSHKNSKQALWVAIKQDVPITWDSVAHIVVDNEAVKQEMYDKLVNGDGSGLASSSIAVVTCPILTRLASDVIREVLQKTYTYVILPNWKQHLTGSNDYHAMPYLQIT